MISMTYTQITLAIHCAICRGRLGKGSIFMCETEVHQGIGDPSRILGWHPECCPPDIKARYEEITSREHTGTE